MIPKVRRCCAVIFSISLLLMPLSASPAAAKGSEFRLGKGASIAPASPKTRWKPRSEPTLYHARRGLVPGESHD